MFKILHIKIKKMKFILFKNCIYLLGSTEMWCFELRLKGWSYLRWMKKDLILSFHFEKSMYCPLFSILFARYVIIRLRFKVSVKDIEVKIPLPISFILNQHRSFNAFVQL